MESNDGDPIDPHEALSELERLRVKNERSLRRPDSYWLMLGGFGAIWALMPLINEMFDTTLSLSVVLGLILLIAGAAVWGDRGKRKTRSYRLDGVMSAQLLGFAVLCGVLVMISIGMYGRLGFWWIPVLMAVVTFAATAFAGSVMDRHWAKKVSYRV